jgi:hypothetical protein
MYIRLLLQVKRFVGEMNDFFRLPNQALDWTTTLDIKL